MTRAILLALTLSACTAQATQPAPCAQPADERIELRGSEDVTSAALEEMYGSNLEGKPQ